MDPEVAEALAGLNAYVPNGTNNYEFFYEFTDWVEALGNPVDIVEPIFRYIEKYPDADYGAPGPLVHLLESGKAYEAELAASIARHPTGTAVLMVGRILNSSLSYERQDYWLKVLDVARTHPIASDFVRDRAARFILKNL